MKSLMYGGAAAALLVGLAFQVHAEIAVREAPVHAVPLDEDDAPPADVPAPAKDDAPAPAKAEAATTTVKVVEAPAPVTVDAPAAKDEPAAVKALTPPKAPSAPALTAEESAFFTALGQRVTDAASAYENYVRRAGGIDPAFGDAASVRRAVKVGAAYHPRQLEEGIVAYAALIALRNQEFVDGVRAIQNPAFADGLAAHPQQVMQLRGAPGAAADAAGVLKAQGEALIAAGKAVAKAAYDIQTQPWSKSPVADPQGVLDATKASADEMRYATVPSKEKLLDSLVAAPHAAAQGADASAPAPEVVRGLALAALAILGRTGDGMEASYEALLHDASSADCLKLAKLNLNQCLAVAGPNYEDAYCAGRHAVSDTGRCIAHAAAGGPAPDAASPPKLQEVEGIGPEQAAVYGKASPADAAGKADGDADKPAPAPAVAAGSPPAPAQAPAPPQYAQAPRAEPMPDPQTARQPPPAAAPPYAPPQGQPQPYNYAQNDYYAQRPAQPAPYPAPPYRQPYAQPQYQTQPYPQPYPQPQYAPQPYAQPYAPQPYSRPQATYAPNYGQQQPYYPQPQGYPAYQGSYYGR
jgi:hypothetical protein